MEEAHVVDLNRLRTFVTVAREGNLTRAADILCLSQPAVSGQVKALEDELGLKLFRRFSRGMELTQAGRALLNEAEQAITSALHVKARAQTLREGVGGELRIGTITEPAILRLGQTLGRLSSKHPGLRLSLLQGISGDVIEWAIEGRIDAGYVIGAPDDPRVIAVQVAPVTLRVVAPAAWASRIRGLDWAGIAKLPWIATPAKCSFSRLANQMFARHTVRLQATVEADQEHTLRGLVASGVGLTVLREDVALEAQAAGEVVIWKPGIEVSHLYFIFAREREATPALRAMLDAVNDVWERRRSA